MNSAIGEHDGRAVQPEDATEAVPARTEQVCVVGLGYVGLPLAVGFDGVGHEVTGFDVDETTVETLRDGVDATGDLGDDAVADAGVTYTTDPAGVAEADYVLVAVPTPVDERDRPDLRYVEEAGRTVGRHATPGTTVVLESTVFPGATREVFLPAIAEASGLVPGEEFAVAYSPERATPGDPDHGLRQVVKVVGGQTDRVRDDVADLYGTVVEAGVHRAPSIEVAEASKVVENVQRDVNIAFVNELATVFDGLDVDVDTRAVLDAAGTKWNFHDYRPGLVGGHCIPVDPYFLVDRAGRAGVPAPLARAARRVNESVPGLVARQAVDSLREAGKSAAGSRLLVLGFTYKPDVADCRSTKVADVVERLRGRGVEVVVADPYADPEAVPAGVEVRRSPSFAGFDGVVLATAHEEYRALDLDAVAAALADDPVLVDATGTVEAARADRAGFTHRSL